MGKKKSVIIDDSVVEEPKKQAASHKTQESRKVQDVIPARHHEVGSTLGVEAGIQLADSLTESENSASDSNSEVTEIASPAEPISKGSSKTKKEDKKSKRATKKEVKRKANHSEKYQKANESIEKSKRYLVLDAVEKAKASSYSKFNGTVELHLNTAQKNMRGLVSLPFATGRKLTVLAFGNGAEASGADIVGSDEKIATIQKGKVDFDVVVTTADWMPKLAKIAAILGPRGLMPNPKSGTITTDLKKAVTEIQSGKVEYKTDRNAQVMHLSIGKTTQASEEIVANIKALINSIGKTRIKKAVLAPTMGPAVKVDLNSL